MPNGFDDRPGEPARNPNATPEERQKAAGGFENDLLKDIIPFIDSHYPTIPDRDHRALCGLSMGGGQTMRIGPPHSDTFAWLGVFTPASATVPAGPTRSPLTRMPTRSIAISSSSGFPAAIRTAASPGPKSWMRP